MLPLSLESLSGLTCVFVMQTLKSNKTKAYLLHSSSGLPLQINSLFSCIKIIIITIRKIPPPYTDGGNNQYVPDCCREDCT